MRNKHERNVFAAQEQIAPLVLLPFRSASRLAACLLALITAPAPRVQKGPLEASHLANPFPQRTGDQPVNPIALALMASKKNFKVIFRGMISAP